MLVGWGLCTPFHLNLFQHMGSSSFQEEDVVIRNGSTPEERDLNLQSWRGFANED